MRKKISLIAINNDVLTHYQNELKSIYGRVADINTYNIEDLYNTSINSDLIIISSPYTMEFANPYIRENIMFLELSFDRKGFEYLKSIKADSKVLCIHNFSIRAIEIVNYLKRLGINHIELIPISPENSIEEIPDYDSAITFFPKTNISLPKEGVINLGWRKIDILTLIKINSRLGIYDSDIISSIRKYAENIVSVNHDSNMFQKGTKVIKDKLNNIIDKLDDGLIILDSEGNILEYNSIIFKIFDIPNEVLYLRRAEDIFKETFQFKELSIDGYFEEKLLKLERNNKFILISRKLLSIDNGSRLDIITIKDATKLVNLERTLRKETVSMGYVAKYNFDDIVGDSKIIKQNIKSAKKFAETDLPILLLGESGTGKELFAHSVHNWSDRKKHPFVGINCLTLPSSLLESELFGYEEGAFTGASKGGKEGLFELANTGTLFLDEIGDLSLEFQGKLLRFLEEKEIIKVGGSKIISLDTRIIAATNKDLSKLVKENKFRQDLYYRLNILSLTLPALRERREDIKLIIDNIVNKLCNGKIYISDEVYNILSEYDWEGNIRQLRNCIQYMIVMGKDNITKEHIPEYVLNEMSTRMKIRQELNELSKGDEEVISIIKEILLINHRIGRRKIVDILGSKGMKVSEYRVRQILKSLGQQ